MATLSALFSVFYGRQCTQVDLQGSLSCGHDEARRARSARTFERPAIRRKHTSQIFVGRCSGRGQQSVTVPVVVVCAGCSMALMRFAAKDGEELLQSAWNTGGRWVGPKALGP